VRRLCQIIFSQRVGCAYNNDSHFRSFTVLTMEGACIDTGRLSKIASLHLKRNFLLLSVPLNHYDCSSSFIEFQKQLSSMIQIVPVSESTNEICATILEIVQPHDIIQEFVHPHCLEFSDTLCKSLEISGEQCSQLFSGFGSLAQISVASAELICQRTSLSWEEAQHICHFFEEDQVQSQ